MSVTTNLLGTIPAVIGGPEGTVQGTDTGEWIIGTDADNVIAALGGDDFVQALAGNDQIDAGDGNDAVLAGEGDDSVEGGTGDDAMRGDAGADRFLFDPSRAEGADSIVDLTATDLDVIALSAAGLAAVGLQEFSGAALDASDLFNLVGDAETGDLVIQHPGGTITLNGVPFAQEGQPPPTFAGLEAAGLLVVPGVIQGTDAGEALPGTDDADVIVALGGDDTITPLSGDDSVATGAGRDTVNLDPSNPNEGADVLTDFTAPSSLDPTVGDSLNFALADLLEADPGLPAADGDATSLSLADFDASANWTLGASEVGTLLFTHPNGSAELANAAFSGQTFAGLGAVIKVDGAEFTQPIPVGAAGGEGAAGGDDVAGGEDTVDGEAEVAEPSPSDSIEDAIA